MQKNASPKASQYLFTLKPQNPKNKYQLKESNTLLKLSCKIKSSQVCINYHGVPLWNTKVLGPNSDLEQPKTITFLRRNFSVFSFLTMLNFYFETILYLNTFYFIIY